MRDCSEEEYAQASSYCEMMSNLTGPFRECLRLITDTSKGHIESCMFDVCSNKGSETVMRQMSCNALSIMEQECLAFRVVVQQWRRLAQCGKFVEC